MPRPGTVPIKQVLNAPNSGSRTQFGTMVPSTKTSAAQFSIGTEKRNARSAGETLSPGPVYVPKPTSKWLGDSPAYSMGTSQRVAMGGASRYVPGPDVYSSKSSVGYQVESFKTSSPTVGIGTEGRQQHTGKRNPIYTDSLFPSVSCLSNQLLSNHRTFPHGKIGTDSRFRESGHEQSPGPGNYKSKSSLGNQTSSQNKTGNKKTFGVRHSMKANNAGSSASGNSPGPAGYRLRDGIGRQVNSKNRSSATFSVGTAQRFQRANAAQCGPGPGSYQV